MEADGGGVNTPSTAAADSTPIPVPVPSPPPPPPDVPHISPGSSPETADSYLDGAGPVPGPADDQPAPRPQTLTDDLRDKIIRQVEYYFSDENLPTDKFLMKYMTKNGEGYVPIAIIATFRKLKKLTQDRSLITEALKHSSCLVISPNGKKVKRLHPLPVDDVKDPKLCTVLVENLPEDHSTENIQKIFAAAGNIKNVCIHDPSTVQEPRKRTLTEKLLSAKLHALVEYETVEAAEKAVSLLNNEQDWRFGMRVKLLKREKQGQKQKAWKGPDPAKSSSVQASDPSGDAENCLNEHHDETHEEEEGDLPSKDKNGPKGRNRRRGKGLNGRGTNVQGQQGHGHGPVHINHGVEHVKPPPGPKMPDGTRGFTMGRGRPLASSPI